MQIVTDDFDHPSTAEPTGYQLVDPAGFSEPALQDIFLRRPPTPLPSFSDSSDSKSRPSKLFALDLIRIAATFWIVSFHTLTNLRVDQNTEVAYVKYARFGVEVFFILSGFILTFVNFSRFNSQSVREFRVAYGRFLLGRILRIWPLHAAVTAYYYHANLFCPWQYALKDLLFANVFFKDNLSFCNVSAWFLHYEMYVCALLPFVLLAVNKFRPAIFGVFAGSLGFIYFYLAFVLEKWVYSPSLFLIRGVAFFFTGVWLGYCYLRWPVQHAVFDLIAAVALYLWHDHWMGTFEQSIPWISQAVVLTIVIIYCLAKGRLFNFLASHPVVTCLGEWSFGIYLMHLLMYINFRNYLERLKPCDTRLDFFVVVAILYLITLPVAVAGFYIIEDSVSKHSRKLLERAFPAVRADLEETAALAAKTAESQ